MKENQRRKREYKRRKWGIEDEEKNKYIKNESGIFIREDREVVTGHTQRTSEKDKKNRRRIPGSEVKRKGETTRVERGWDGRMGERKRRRRLRKGYGEGIQTTPTSLNVFLFLMFDSFPSNLSFN